MTRRRTTYHDHVRTFDHSALAALQAYPALRQALNDIADQAAGYRLADFLQAVADMAATTPYGDTCRTCSRQLADMRTYWPHAAERDGEHITGTYRCAQGHPWTCGYHVGIAGML